MNPYNNYNMGMNNFYPNQFSTTLAQPQMTTQNLIRVNGIDGAKAYQMPANSTVALFDNNEDIMYIKTKRRRIYNGSFWYYKSIK